MGILNGSQCAGSDWSRSYARAIEPYTGDLLATETADWVVGRREYCRALAQQALNYLRADAVRRGDQPLIIELWSIPSTSTHTYEEPQQTLMLMHGHRSELGQVRNWHDMCVKRFRDDLDVTQPSPPTESFTGAVEAV